MANDIKLGSNEHPISEDLSTVTVGGERTSLEISRPGGGARIDGGLEVNGNIKGSIISTDLLIDDIVCDDLSAGGATVNLQNIKLTKNSYDQIITAISHPDTDAIQDIYLYTKVLVANVQGFYLGDLDTDDALIFKFRCDSAQFFIYPPENADDADYFSIQAATNGATTLSTVDAAGEEADLLLSIDGKIDIDSATNENITLDAGGKIVLESEETITIDNNMSLASGKVIYFDSADTKIGSNDDNPEDMVIEADEDILMSPDASLVVDAGAGITLDSATGVFEMLGAGSTAKFADMYAGMILGYTALGIDSADDSYTTTTSWAVIDSTAKVTFVAPPSGIVEIFVSVYVDTDIARWLEFGLSDNASYSPIDFPNSNDVTNEHIAYKGDETDEEMVSHQWAVTGLTAGDSYEWWFAVRSSPSAGAYTLKWGGNVTSEYAPFIMKATALPSTIYTG